MIGIAASGSANGSTAHGMGSATDSNAHALRGGLWAHQARWLLLAYSLSPALAKLAGVDALFGVGLLLLAVYLLVVQPPPHAWSLRSWLTGLQPGVLLLAFVSYAVLLGGWWCLLGLADTRAALIGGFSFLVPLLMMALAGQQRAKRLLGDLPFVAVVHAALALLMFPPTRPPIEVIETLSETLLAGTAAFRLSSVSGSLALSTCMVVAFAMTLSAFLQSPAGSARSRRHWVLAAVFLLCGFLSLQRAAWLSLATVMLAALAAAPRQRRLGVLAVLGVVVAPLALAVWWVDLPEDAMEVFIDRFATLTGGGEIGAVAERSDQWLNTLFNLRELPVGHGPGQLGQAVRDTGVVTGGLPVFDGDYFRIISEYGPIGMGLVLLLLWGGVRALRRLVGAWGEPAAAHPAIVSATVLSLLLQAVGTNVTELYFANTVFWCVWLQAWQPPPASRGPTQPVA
jgi:hypothetical protein